MKIKKNCIENNKKNGKNVSESCMYSQHCFTSYKLNPFLFHCKYVSLNCLLINFIKEIKSLT